MDDKTKTCKRCKQKKSIYDFYINNRTRDGLSIYCKACQIELNKSYNAKPLARERKKEYNRLYKKQHPRNRWKKDVINKRIAKKKEQIIKLLKEIIELKLHLDKL